MRAPERSLGDKPLPFCLSGNRMDLGGLQGLLQAHRREDGVKPLGQHGLSRAGRTNKDYIMSASCSDFYASIENPQIAGS